MIYYDLAIVAGVGCVAFAGYLIHPALPWLVCGGAAAAWGVAGARVALRKDRKK